MSLRRRLGLAAGAAVAIAVVAVAVSSYEGTRSELRGQLDRALQSLARPILARAGGGPGGPAGQGADVPGSFIPGVNPLFPASGLPRDCDRGSGIDEGPPGFGGATGERQYVTPDGVRCTPRGGVALPIDAAVRRVAAAGRGSFFTDVTVSGHHLREYVFGYPRGGAVQLALDATSVDSTLRDELLMLALIAVGGIALAALLGFLVARAAIAPISRFTKRTESIARSPERIETERLPVEGADELARLASTFNATLDALAESVAAQRNLVADASHELRTPIATLRANLQLLREEERLSPEDRQALRADMIEELDELTRLVGDVVELARGAKPALEAGEVRLDEIVEQAVERSRRRAPALSFEAELEPTLVRGDGERIARAVSNLLDNASKWSRPGGRVEVSLAGGVVSVRDHGPGFDERELPYVFDRFHRAADARSKPGSGLGLAIVRQAAEAHGGHAEAANAPGGGALLRVSFGPQLPLDVAAIGSARSA